MIIIITGSPGTGKTTIARELSKKTQFPVINEQKYALAHNIGLFDPKTNELVVPLDLLEKSLSKHLLGLKSVILEGHLLCEMALNADLCIVLRINPDELEKRLKQRKYSDEKILDNVFCEQTGFCLEKAKENYLYIKEAVSFPSIRKTVNEIHKFIKEIN
ncbi:MAG: AAA family ATPase [Candidatus Diapherotrites archaeon]